MDNELHSIDNSDPGRPITPHRSGGGVNIGTIGHHRPNMGLVAILAALGGMEYGIGNPMLDMGLERFADTPKVKDEHDYARIAKAEERRARRNAKRLKHRESL